MASVFYKFITVMSLIVASHVGNARSASSQDGHSSVNKYDVLIKGNRLYNGRERSIGIVNSLDACQQDVFKILNERDNERSLINLRCVDPVNGGAFVYSCQNKPPQKGNTKSWGPVCTSLNF